MASVLWPLFLTIIFVGIVAFLGKVEYWFRSGYISQRTKEFGMGNQWLARFIKIGQHPIFPFTVGFVIACAVFALTYTFAAEWTSILMVLILSAPGLMASFVLSLHAPGLMPSFVLDPQAAVMFGSLVSGSYFGSMVGFLVSKPRYLRMIGILLVLLLIFFSCYLSLLLGFSD